MADVSLDLDPAMVDNLRREADEHGFEEVDGYVEWLLGHRDTVLNEHDVWSGPSGDTLDADLGQSSGPSLDPDRSTSTGSGSGEEPSLEPERADEPPVDADSEPNESEADPKLPEEDGADDDDVAAALEEIELDDE